MSSTSQRKVIVKDPQTSSPKPSQPQPDFNPNIPPVEKKAAYANIPLPSKGLPYRKFYDKNTIAIRPLELEEVKAVKAIFGGGSNLKLNSVLAGVFQDFRTDQLTFGDYLYCLAWLRENTYMAAPIEVPWTCPECQTENVCTVHLQKMTMIELPDNFREPMVIQLPVSKKEVRLRLERMGDDEIVDRYLKGMLNKTEWDDSEEWLPRLALTIDNGADIHVNVQFLQTLAPEDVTVIEAVGDEFEHGLPSLLTDTCTGKKSDGSKEVVCGFVNKRIRFDFRVLNLLPVADYRGFVRNGVRFGG